VIGLVRVETTLPYCARSRSNFLRLRCSIDYYPIEWGFPAPSINPYPL
jgi:hypothetical protein